MTHVQELLVIGIPSVLVMLSWASFDMRVAALCKRVDNVVDRLGTVDSRSGGLCGRIDALADSRHRDMLQLLQIIVSLHERVVIVEARQA